MSFKDPEMPKANREKVANAIETVCRLQGEPGKKRRKTDKVWPLEDPQWSEDCHVELIYVSPGDLVCVSLS
jgi:hypothetical protein